MPVELMPRVRHGHHFLKKRTCCVFQWSGSRRRFLRGFPGSKTLACPIGCVPGGEVSEALPWDALALSKEPLQKAAPVSIMLGGVDWSVGLGDEAVNAGGSGF